MHADSEMEKARTQPYIGRLQALERFRKVANDSQYRNQFRKAHPQRVYTHEGSFEVQLP